MTVQGGSVLGEVGGYLERLLEEGFGKSVAIGFGILSLEQEMYAGKRRKSSSGGLWTLWTLWTGHQGGSVLGEVGGYLERLLEGGFGKSVAIGFGILSLEQEM